MLLHRFILLFLISLLSCSTPDKGVKGKNSFLSSQTVKISALMGGQVTFSVPLSIFGIEEKALKSNFDVQVGNQPLAFGVDTSPFFNVHNRDLEITVKSPMLEQGKKIKLVINKPDRMSFAFQAFLSRSHSSQAYPLVQKPSNEVFLIVNSICNRIRDCTPIKDEAFCSLGLTAEPVLGNQFMETKRDEKITLLALSNGFKNGQYGLAKNDTDACLLYLDSIPCQGRGATVAAAYDPKTPLNFSHIKNLIPETAPCAAVVEGSEKIQKK